jgi:hypothetical protein
MDFDKHGEGTVTAIARKLRQDAAVRAPGHDLTRFRFDRFGGARPARGPAL